MPEHDLAFGDESSLAAEVRDVLGVGPYDQVVAVTPQFERLEGGKPPWTPKTMQEFASLEKLSDAALRLLCLKQWDKGHWLYPGEWYDSIPKDYIVVDISGQGKPFLPGRTDRDIRFGCLAYGFKREQDIYDA